jgi:hypothetical protein
MDLTIIGGNLRQVGQRILNVIFVSVGCIIIGFIVAQPLVYVAGTQSASVCYSFVGIQSILVQTLVYWFIYRSAYINEKHGGAAVQYFFVMLFCPIFLGMILYGVVWSILILSFGIIAPGVAGSVALWFEERDNKTFALIVCFFIAQSIICCSIGEPKKGGKAGH